MAANKRVALVTGSAQGIGKAIALRLTQDGFVLALNDLPSKTSQLQSLKEEIASKGGRAGIFIGDISNEDDVKSMIDSAVRELGSLDVMVANGALCLPGSLLEYSTADWDRSFTVNCRGTFLCYKYAAIQMIKQGRGGRIVGASSGAGKQGPPLMGAYGSTKFAIRGLTQTAAQEFGKYGITVNAYAPGPIETEFLRKSASDMFPENPNFVVESYTQRAAMGRIGQPEDVAGLVAYLVREDTSFITGQSVSIDGGLVFD